MIFFKNIFEKKIDHKAYLVFLTLLFVLGSGSLYSQCTAVIGSNITPIKGCEILTIQFNDLSTGAVQSRIWDFGDGSATIGAQNPQHSYSAGIIGDTTYIVTLNTQCVSGPPSIAYDTVFVYKKPKVDFLSNKLTLCALTDSACFTNLSSLGAGNIYLWNFGDFTSSTQFQPCHTYSTGGVYSVQLSVTNAHGCANSLTYTNYISVIPAPNLDFNISSFVGCSPMSVNFTNVTDTNSTSFSSWQWNFGDGTPDVNAFNPPAHTFVLPGTYFITMSATNSLGCSNLTTKGIIVRTTPTSVFTVTSPVCVGSNSLLTYTGISGSGASFNWNFSGGIANPGTGVGPQNTYWNTSGTKNISLSIADSGCTTTTTVPVIVNPVPSVILTVSPNDTICQGQLVTFTATPATLINYSFYKNGVLVQNSSGNSFVLSNLNSGDSFYVIGTNSNNCTSLNSNVINMTVKPLPAVSLSSSNLSVCSNSTLQFTASPSGYNSYTFYQGFLSLQNSSGNLYSSTTWQDGNSIYVIATNNGCIGDSSNVLTPIISQPLPAPQVNCGTSTDTTIEFTWLPIAGATGYIISINGDPYTAPSSGNLGTNHIVTGLIPGNSATIAVIAIGPAPCGNSDTSSIQTCFANNCSAITFSIDPYQTICSGESITLSLSGYNIANPLVSWNGGPALANNNSYTFAPLTNTTVNVIVSNPLQPTCVPVSNNFIIQTTPLPVVALSVNPLSDSICNGTPIIFSASPAGFNNYSFYNGQSLVQNSNDPTYTVTGLSNGNSIYVVPENNGCTGKASDTISKIIFQPLPTPQVNCATTTTSSIQFIWNSITGSTGYLVSVNGASFISPSSGNNGTTHLITGLSPGDSATIVVIALGNYPCGNSLPSAIHTCYAMNCSPITFNFNPYQTICSGEPITLTLSTFNIINPIISWNGGPFLSNNNTVTFSPSNDTLVNFSVSDALQTSCGSISNFFVITVDPLPTVTLSISQQDDTTCSGTPIVFSASPLGYTNYSFYQGFLLLQSSASSIYSGNLINGNSIHVVATNNGCIGTASNNITPTIIQPLNTPQVNCATTTNTTIEFTWNAITDASGYIVSVNGGPFISPSSGSNGTTHLVTGLTPGSSASIVVVGLGSLPCGNSLPSSVHICSATNCSAITFNYNPFQTICSGNSITLTLSGFNIANPNVSWNGGPSLSNNNSITISPLTTDTVNFSVSDPLQLSCTPVSNYFIIQVNPTPVATLSMSPSTSSICQGVPTIFTASPAGFSDYSFYDGSTLLQSSNNPTYTSPNTISGNISIHVVTSNQGCQFTGSALALTILPSPTVTLTANPSSSQVCYQDTVVFSASPAAYANYTFYNGNTVLQSSSAASLALSSMSIGSGNIITVDATNSSGCTSNTSNSLNFTVLAPPVISLTCSDPDLIICSGDPVTFTASPSGMPLYQFYNVSTLLQSSNNSIFTSSVLQPGNSIYSIATSAQGCTSFPSNAFSITVKPRPVAFISATDTTICAGTTVTLSANLNPVTAGTNFQWNTGFTDTTILVSPAVTTSYTLNSDLNGCSGTPATLTILVDNNPPPVTNAGVNTTICKGDSLTLSGSGGAFMYWTPSVGLSDSTNSNPHCSPPITTTYTLHSANLYCYSSDNLTISIDLCLSDITGPIPTCITPNGDGANDLFIIPNVDYFEHNSLVIYNRWGNVIYKEAPYTNNWDGRSNNGQELPDAIYYYVFDLGDFVDHKNEEGQKVHKGYVLIQR
ncbi:MAG: hypothetical protein A3F72_14410 [Bacteroidetes bacterium RIFCSPLOWO2_12_FULL_35_15]|nr:MAG: hypothetical protein A3F72_14410 [Bacteroidetes bacterium RIFCSPLOWO2_12_FULL_35_15]